MAVAEQQYDLVILGAGPAGYVAAIRAAQLGMRPACIERSTALGGTCLNVGCIPSKALLDSTHLYHQITHKAKRHGINVESASVDLQAMMARKERIVTTLSRGVQGLLKKHGVALFSGTGFLEEPTVARVEGDAGTTRLRGTNVLLATGSVPRTGPHMALDGQRIVGSTEALSLNAVPAHLVIVGGGCVGVEMASIWRRLGAAVTLIEAAPTLLPSLDPDVAKEAGRALSAIGVKLHTGTRAVSAVSDGSQVRVATKPADNETSAEAQEVTGDTVLIAIGRRPNTDGTGVADLGVKLSEDGQVRVDEHLRCGVPGLWAAGDVVGAPMLAHKAYAEGVAAVENMAGLPGYVNYRAIPQIVYTWPEAASIGMTEAQAIAAGHDVRTGKFAFAANGRAKCLDDMDGFVKVLADRATDRVLGVHIFGPHASALAGEAALAMEFDASAEDIGAALHAHPTLNEAVKEAALDALGRVLHA